VRRVDRTSSKVGTAGRSQPPARRDVRSDRGTGASGEYGRKERLERIIRGVYREVEEVDRDEAIGPGREATVKKARRLLVAKVQELGTLLQSLEEWQKEDPVRFDFVQPSAIQGLQAFLQDFERAVNKKNFARKWGKFYDTFPCIMGFVLRDRRSEGDAEESEDESPDHLPAGFYEVGQGGNYHCGTKPFREVWE
jgi:hypothetical protein